MDHSNSCSFSVAWDLLLLSKSSSFLSVSVEQVKQLVEPLSNTQKICRKMLVTKQQRYPFICIGFELIQ